MKTLRASVGHQTGVTCVLLLALVAGRAAMPAGAGAGKAFAIQQRQGIHWLTRPNGEHFFSFGVCCVDQGVSRKDFDPHNPGFAAWQHYAGSNQWAEATLQRLKSWRFTTIGGWSDFPSLQQ